MNKTKNQKARIKNAAETLNQAKRSAAESKERAAPYDVILQTESTALVERGRKEIALSEAAQQLTGGDSDRALAEKYSHKAKSPTMIDAAASQTRLELADKAKCLELALDAVQGIENPTAIEKMLIHQMAAAYQLSMKLMEKANDFSLSSIGKMNTLPAGGQGGADDKE